MIPRETILRAGTKVKFNITELRNISGDYFINQYKPEGIIYKLEYESGVGKDISFRYGNDQAIGNFSRAYLDIVSRKPTIIIEED